MGREWYLNWGTKSSSKKGGGTKGGGDGSGREKKSAATQAATVAAAAAAGGCMNAVVHMFDFSHFHLCLHPHNGSYLVDDPTPLKGVEAPRNSLESEEEKDDSLGVLMNIQTKTNRRHTRLKLVQGPRGKIEDISSESSCSPGAARTPTLVARLMGLDVLPESCNTTPKSSSSSHSQISHSPHIKASTPPSRARKTQTKGSYNNDVVGPRSLPETPRSSSSQRRRSADVVENHRLSLQINKENSIVKEMESSRPSCSAINTKRREGRNYEDGNKSPGYYARQIMKQVKETVSRRVGVDITNTIAQRELRRDELLLSTTTTTKSKKSKKDPSLSSSTSPKLRNLESSNKLRVISENIPPLESATSIASEVAPKQMKLQVQPFGSENEKQLKHEQLCFDIKKNTGDAKQCSKKLPPKTYDSIRNKDEQFVRPTRANTTSDKKCKKTPLSSELLHGSVPSLVPFKKDNSSSILHTKLLENQEASSKAQLSKPITNNNITSTTTRLSCNPSPRTYGNVHEEATRTPAVQERKKHNTTSSSTTAVAEFQYISRILKCTGIDRDTPISFTRWFSTTNPLDPSIFAKLETAHYLTLSDLNIPSDYESSFAINRKLIFHLVDEILADILRPHIRAKPWSLGFLRQDYRRYDQYHYQQQQQLNGFQLVKTLCTRIRSFPSADCQTLQDIDALVEKDLPTFGATSTVIEFEEEGEAIVTEIERQIMDSLVQEVAAFCISTRSSSSRRFHANIC